MNNFPQRCFRCKRIIKGQDIETIFQKKIQIRLGQIVTTAKKKSAAVQIQKCRILRMRILCLVKGRLQGKRSLNGVSNYRSSQNRQDILARESLAVSAGRNNAEYVQSWAPKNRSMESIRRSADDGFETATRYT